MANRPSVSDSTMTLSSSISRPSHQVAPANRKSQAMIGGTQCRMSGVSIIQECSGTSRGSSAHAGISEIGTSGVWPCQENGNYFKWVAN